MITKTAEYKYKSAISRQKQFLKKIQTETYNGVLGLDTPLEETKNLSLRQIIMSTKSQGRNERLFLGVESQYNLAIKFVFKEEDRIEALEFINAMPKILEYHYDRHIWN